MFICANMKIKSIAKQAKFYKALGEPIRLKIIKFLWSKKNGSCICHLSEELNRDQSVIFRHVQILKEVDLIKTTKKEKFLWCEIKNRRYLKRLLEI